jgi:Protein of unknown function (DUF3489)
MSNKPTRTATRPIPRTAARGASHKRQRSEPTKAAAKVKASTGTKQSQLIAMLRSPAGGTMEQMIKLTGWQPHTLRGTISGALRKRLKLNVACTGGTFRIVESQA